MKSLLYQDGGSPHVVPPGCGLCDRTEVPVSIRADGRIYRFTLRDKLVVEDPYLVAVKANAFAIQQGEPYAGTVTPRNVRDFLIKTRDVVI
jgi:hypothetical protein